MKRVSKLLWLAAMAGACYALDLFAEPTSPPLPYGSLPSSPQLRWQALEFYGFLHFGMNTFTDKEWGYGNESPTLFNPTAFDADQIVQTAQDAGMKGLILVCKHHDGFCLWPSATTEHSVKNSPWHGGKGDVVKEIADACHKHGLLFGVYLSPWDRSRGDYGRPEYLDVYRAQLRELLTRYGEVFIAWFDGANGGEGWYGGARGVRRIDPKTYYGWPETWALVRQLQPQAVIFSDAGPDVRWVGNELGLTGEPCWATLNLAGLYPGTPNCRVLPNGRRGGTNWVPAECNVSIRPSWFYHPREDGRVKTAAQLVNLYYTSVGHGACLNLNIPPDRRGLIPDKDAESLRGLRAWLDATFKTNCAANAQITASNTRGNSKAFAPANLLDNDRNTYWATDDTVTNAEVVLTFKQPITVNVVRLREYLPLGQRVDAFALDRWTDNQWQEFYHGTSIGNQRLVRTAPFTTDKIRLRITQAAVCPALSELSVFREPIPTEQPSKGRQIVAKNPAENKWQPEEFTPWGRRPAGGKGVGAIPPAKENHRKSPALAGLLLVVPSGNDGVLGNRVIKLGQPAIKAGFRGVHAFLQPLERAGDGHGKVVMGLVKQAFNGLDGLR